MVYKVFLQKFYFKLLQKEEIYYGFQKMKDKSVKQC